MDFIKKNFMAVCILISAFILSVAIMFSALCNRYYLFKDSKSFMIFDKLTGSTHAVYGEFTGEITIRDIKRASKTMLEVKTK